MSVATEIGPLKIDSILYRFVTDEALPGSDLDERTFWNGFARLLQRFAPRNAELLAKRDRLQAAIDDWHRLHPGARLDAVSYRAFLIDIGYLLPESDPFVIDTAHVDAEIAAVAGPQLVVPVSNARYALNAANARWGSLYDALYGTDVISEEDGASRTGDYNPTRGAKVIAFTRDFLDATFPLLGSSHRDAVAYRVGTRGLEVTLRSGATTGLASPASWVGFQGDRVHPSVLLLVHHGLHVELRIDRQHRIGREDPAGLSDVILESAITTIQDCEDSVAAVNALEKVNVYRNWLGLMRGNLEARVVKGSKMVQRRLDSDRIYTTPQGTTLTLPGRSLMLVRNVGHNLLTDMITLDGRKIPETLIDLAVTSLAALHDLRADVAPPGSRIRNSRSGSVYIVKPKLHGPEEVAFADELFAATEDLLRLPRHTLKMGIMDEERRTSVNLMECIRAARHRLVFINTGFLDRTGDEIHTSMEAAPVPRKSDLKKALWLDTYERQNVDLGLACGLRGHAQIGKGMWAMPDRMADMLSSKIGQLQAGANTAWVPSPTAATLHAIHYHRIDVDAVQASLVGRTRAPLDDLLTPPLVDQPAWTSQEIMAELCNNAQSILGYVVRWIDFGIGCSKVPDYYDVALMEDRATLRISSQHVANWLRHGICTPDQVLEALRSMAKVVDAQNAEDPAYRPMSADLDNSIAFHAARDLIFQGRMQANGYTETILTARRREQITRQALIAGAHPAPPAAGN